MKRSRLAITGLLFSALATLKGVIADIVRDIDRFE